MIDRFLHHSVSNTPLANLLGSYLGLKIVKMSGLAITNHGQEPNHQRTLNDSVCVCVCSTLGWVSLTAFTPNFGQQKATLSGL